MTPKQKKWKYPAPIVGLLHHGPRGPTVIEPRPSAAQLREWTSRIGAGEQGDEVDALARSVLHDFAFRQLKGVRQNPATLLWLAESIGKILDGAEPLSSLGLAPRKPQRPASSDLAMRVGTWIAATEQRGYSKSEATSRAAKVFSMDVSNVRKLARKVSAVEIRGDFEQFFMAKKRPLPQRKSGKK